MLKDKLIELNNNLYPFHMPGHKRNESFLNFPNPATIDITEIDGFDNLHCANGVIKEIEDKIKNISCSKECLISVNGSSGAILSSIFASTKKGDKVIIARNCHKAVYNACYLNELDVTYIEPVFNNEFGFYQCISPKEVKNTLLKNNDIKLVVITSPTYEGCVSDVKSIADICHENGVPLFVDEAHGAHFSYSSLFPTSATELGADIVCQSYHKTLPSLTQTSVLLFNSALIDFCEVKKYMSIFETSSPSYVLMSSIENVLNIKQEDFNKYYNRINQFYIKTKLNNLCFYLGEEAFKFDKSKIIVSTKSASISGVELADILRKEYKIECEMSSTNYIILMTSVADTDVGFNMLSNALIEIDKKVNYCKSKTFMPTQLPKKAKKSYEVESLLAININEANGKICGEYIFSYPPGIPIIVPGEIINEKTIKYINNLINDNVNVISESLNLPLINIDNS